MSHVTQEELYAVYDEELSEPERLRIEEHLRVCAQCREVVEEWEGIAGTFFKPPRVAPSEAFVERVMQGLPVEHVPRIHPRFLVRFWTPALGFAAALALILAWPNGNGTVSTESILLADIQGQTFTSLVFPSQTLGQDELLGLVLEEL